MSPRFPLLPTLALGLVAAPLASAQTFYFQDGRKASLPEARIQGNSIVVPLKTSSADSGTAEVNYAISKIVKMDWPTPAAVTEADAAFKAGRFEDVLRKIDPVLPGQEPFRDIPGSWWVRAATLRAEALARLGREIDAQVAVEILRRSKAQPEDLARIELAIATYALEHGKAGDAKKRIEAAASALNDDTSLARLAVVQAKLELEAGRTEAALLAYLRVPVFFPDEKDSMPAALLGAAQCLRGINDDARARTTAATLIQRFPNSPEAAEARRDFPNAESAPSGS